MYLFANVSPVALLVPGEFFVCQLANWGVGKNDLAWGRCYGNGETEGLEGEEFILAHSF